MDGQSSAVPREIRTDRLLLRSGRAGDEEALRDALVTSVDSLHPWVSFAKLEHSPESMARVCRDAEDLWTAGEAYVWRMWEPDGSLLVGNVDLHEVDRVVPSCGIGYWLRSSHVGRGLASEAVRAAIAAAREHLGVHRIEARCDVRNARSCQLVERLGFELEGIARNSDRDGDGALSSDRVYALTWDEG